MITGNVTTPFGRRPMTYGMLADQLAAQAIDENASVDKWKLYRWLCEARSRLGISDRALSLLNALLSFYPKTDLCGADSLIVFPQMRNCRCAPMAWQKLRYAGISPHSWMQVC